MWRESQGKYAVFICGCTCCLCVLVANRKAVLKSCVHCLCILFVVVVKRILTVQPNSPESVCVCVSCFLLMCACVSAFSVMCSFFSSDAK